MAYSIISKNIPFHHSSFSLISYRRTEDVSNSASSIPNGWTTCFHYHHFPVFHLSADRYAHQSNPVETASNSQEETPGDTNHNMPDSHWMLESRYHSVRHRSIHQIFNENHNPIHSKNRLKTQSAMQRVPGSRWPPRYATTFHISWRRH